MFEENVSDFFSDFAESVTYSDDQTSKIFNAIVDIDVNLIGDNGEIAGKTTTMTTESDGDIKLGGIFKYKNVNYIVDQFVSDDGFMKTMTVVKQ